MTSRDEIPIDDIAILQLFKDNLLNHSLNGNSVSMSDRVSSDDSELSDLESVISQDARDNQGARGQESRDGWPLSSPTQQTGPLTPSPSRGQVDPSVSSRSGCLADREDLRNPRRCPDLSSSRSRYRRLGKDEKLAQEANLPFTVRTLVGLPMDEFNDLLSKNELSEEQLNVCRDIRRRGKNKVAAQNCRQRKIEQIDELQLKLKKAVDRRDKVKYEHDRLYNVYSMEAERLKKLSETVLNYFNKDNLNFTLQVVGEEVNILPKKEVKEELSPSAMENFDQFLPFNPFYNINLNNNNNYNSPVTQGGCTTQNNPIYELKQFNNFY